MTIALAILDMQQHFLAAKKTAIADYDAACATINEVAKSFRSAGRPVLLLHNAHAQTSSLADGFEIVPDIHTETTDIRLTRSASNSFWQSELAAILTERQVELLLLCGYRSENCILATTAGAKAHGITCSVIDGAHITPKPSAGAAVAQIVPSVDPIIIPALLGGFSSATTPL